MTTTAPKIRIRTKPATTTAATERRKNPRAPLDLAGEYSADCPRDRDALMLGRLFLAWLAKSGGDYDDAADVVAGVARRIDNARAGSPWREGTEAAAGTAKPAGKPSTAKQ
jgi:hypothetical protein